MADIEDEKYIYIEIDDGRRHAEWMHPTCELRFVEREGAHILQQKWSAETTRERNGEEYIYEGHRWLDVPVVDERKTKED